MALPTGGKLVRDRIPEIIRAAGEAADTVRLNRIDYRTALDLKLIEEATEVVQSEDDARIEELADVYEVLLAIAAHLGISWSTILKTAALKRGTHGGFGDRLWLVP